MKSSFVRWQGNFYAGLAIVLPAVISLAIVKWLFGTVSNVTDTLLIFLPKRWTHQSGGAGPMFWYWSLFALGIAIISIAAIGRLARHYLGRKAIQLVDYVMLRVPLLNKIYGAIKQVNEAFTTNKRTSFKQVVMLEFPKAGVYAIGFITGEQNEEVQVKTREKVVSVFVPTTPNPTTGFLILVPENKLTKLDMSIADASKFIISLGSVAPAYGVMEPPQPILVDPTMMPAPEAEKIVVER